jgi:hypothetical protein
VPLAADSLDAERLVGGAPRDTIAFDVTSSQMLQNICAFVLANNLKNEIEPTGVTDLGIVITRSGEYDSRRFVSNSYAMSFKILIDKSIFNNNTNSKIYKLNSLAQDAAKDFSNSELFLENVYSMALCQLANEFNPDDSRIDSCVGTLNTLAQDTAKDFDSTMFLENVYAMVIGQLAGNSKPDDNHIIPWAKNLSHLSIVMLISPIIPRDF